MSNENNILPILYWRKILFFSSWLLLFSCNTTKYLQDDEAFLKKNDIEFKIKGKIKKQKKLKADLLSIVKQKPNTKFLLVNRRWFYYKSKKKQKERRRRRLISEYPSIYNEALAEETANSMKTLLKQKGYFNAEVDFQTSVKRKLASVTYIIQPKDLFTVDTILFLSKDTAIQKVLHKIAGNTLFKSGSPISNQLFEQEKRRIRSQLRNVGYRNFYVNYFDQLATKTDSARTKKLDLSLEIFPINDSVFHQTYTVGEIYVYPFYNPKEGGISLKDTLIDGVHFMLEEESQYNVRTDIIANRIFFKKNELYSQANYDRTLKNLGELGIFKFANIDEKVVEDTKINFNIYLPANQRRSIGGNIEYKNTSLRASTLPSPNLNGIETSLLYQDKNAFGGSEFFNANIRFGIQIGSNESGNFIDNYDISPQFDLSIPKFRDLFGFVRLMNNIGAFGDQFYNSLLDNANTKLSLGLNWSQRRNFWEYFSTDLSLGYEIQNTKNRTYYVKQLGINIFQPNIEDGSAGAEIFDDSPFLQRTFNQNQLFTGLLFREFGFSFSDVNQRNNSSWRLFFNSEISGAEALLVNSIANQFRTENRDTFQVLGLAFSQFGRLDIDGRFTKFFRPTRSFAFRLNTGIAFPFGTSDDVPYVKQFFAGGPNSVRAWRVRELGPGSYRDPSTFPEYRENQVPFYQTGDFKFIFSAEYRFLLFQLFGFNWEGTTFLDGGNVWTLKADPDRPGSQLTTRFWRQIALGTGVGLNIDFDYFILRLDLGYKLRNPYPNPNGSYWAGQEFKELGFKGINYNLGVGRAF